MSTARLWSKAFAEQAGADLAAWERLQRVRELSDCHQLLFLQMACEKLGKAHLCQVGADPYVLQTSHAYIAKQLPIIVKEQITRSTGKRLRRFDPKMRGIHGLCREIELLSPAVNDGGRRPDNCEYPWQLPDGTLRTPAAHRFPGLTLLRSPIGQTLLKCIREAIAQLIQ